ncbi:adenine deaminase-like isoform X2 [Dysidea avara]
MLGYLTRAAADNVQYAEIFFDPQTHTQRGIPFKTVISGLYRATVDGQEFMGIKGRIIISFLRHLSEDEALETLESAVPYLDRIVGMDLDSGEDGNPPKKFSRLFKRAAELGLKLTAHAGEEGGPDYIQDALDQGVIRVNHGVQCLLDDHVVERLKKQGIPLTVCPFSNKKLQVYNRYFIDINITGELFRKGLQITINSDDPAYFGGYITDNFLNTAEEVGFGQEEIYQICCNAFNSTFMSPQDKEIYIRRLQRHKWEMGYAPCPRNIVVFGSRAAQPGSKEYQFAYDVGKLFGAEGYTVITGGYNGIMMAASQGCSDENGTVRGVISPPVFQQRDIFGNKFLTEISITRSLPERLARLALFSENFVVCPGTIGTVAELLLAWNLAALKPLCGAVSPRIFIMRHPWEEVIKNLHDNLKIYDNDMKLLTFVDSADEVLVKVKEGINSRPSYH